MYERTDDPTFLSAGEPVTYEPVQVEKRVGE